MKLTAQHGQHIHSGGVAVGLGELPRHGDDRSVVDRVHARRAGPARKQPEDARAGAKVEHDVAGPDRRSDGSLKRGHAMGVLEILPMFVDDS